MDIKEISDRLEIEDIVTNYANIIDSGDFDKLRDIFSKTRDVFIDYTAVGGISGDLETIIVYLKKALASFPNYQHLISNIALTKVSDHSYSGKVMCFNPMETQEGEVFFLGLWYQDTYIKEEDEQGNFVWRIMSRVEESSWNYNVPKNINVTKE